MSIAVAAAPVAAAPAPSPRAQLIQAAFGTNDKKVALGLIDQALATATQQLAAKPTDHEALLQTSLAIGYRAKLNRAAGDAKAARKGFEALATANPRDPEAALALAGWHLEAVADIGATLAKMMVGASRDTGFAMLDRAVALGGASPLYPAYAALLRIRINPKDVANARTLAERAVAAQATTPIDRIMAQNANTLLGPLRAGNGKDASELAAKLLPFGKIG